MTVDWSEDQALDQSGGDLPLFSPLPFSDIIYLSWYSEVKIESDEEFLLLLYLLYNLLNLLSTNLPILIPLKPQPLKKPLNRMSYMDVILLQEETFREPMRSLMRSKSSFLSFYLKCYKLFDDVENT